MVQCCVQCCRQSMLTAKSHHTISYKECCCCWKQSYISNIACHIASNVAPCVCAFIPLAFFSQSSLPEKVGGIKEVKINTWVNEFFTGGTRINVTGPQNLKHVLITHRHKYVKAKNIRAFVPSVGNGLLTCSHDDHIRQYKMVSPAFSYSNLKGMVAVFQQVADNLVKVSLLMNQAINL